MAGATYHRSQKVKAFLQSLNRDLPQEQRKIHCVRFAPNCSVRLRLIIAISATSQELSVLLKAAQIDDLLSQDQAAISSDTEASKPAPDIVEAALSHVVIINC